MIRREFFKLSRMICGVCVVFALVANLAAAQPAQRNDDRATDATKPAAPAGRFADFLSTLQFYGEWGPIFLHRQGNASSTLVREALTKATVLDAASLDLGWKPGLEARGGVKSGDFGAEVRWFNLGRVFHPWSEGTRTVTPVNWEIPTHPALVGFPAANTSARLSSTLTNVEANLSWQVHRYFALLAGMRHISLDDDLKMGFDTGLNLADMKTTARNTLWGGQLGMEGRYPVLMQDLFLGATVKVALLHNSAKNRVVLVQQFGPSFFAGDRDGQNAWALEPGMDVRYNLSSMITVSVGYQGFWTSRLAQATDQISRVNVVNHGGDVRTRGLWFHGPKAAIVIRFPG